MIKEQSFNAPVQNVAGNNIHIFQSGSRLISMSTEELLSLEARRIETIKVIHNETIRSWPFITIIFTMIIIVIWGFYVFLSLLHSPDIGIHSLSEINIMPFWLIAVWSLFLSTIVGWKMEKAQKKRKKHINHLHRIQQELMDRGEQ